MYVAKLLSYSHFFNNFEDGTWDGRTRGMKFDFVLHQSSPVRTWDPSRVGHQECGSDVPLSDLVDSRSPDERSCQSGQQRKIVEVEQHRRKGFWKG